MLNCIHHTFNHSFMKIYNKIYFYIRNHMTKNVSIHAKNISESESQTEITHAVLTLSKLV